ncbi:asparaginyl-tRNA synthetase [Blyttiomyces helicus]|uniref:Asparagine--tRNA ligase, mitochondrial n=1 Tax=Blyttiomyces helicus TaxID=388810 RepID=A0A4P9WLL5_9FUNG|nr:asparaginyl-tRNA synthetase [Blyttiomyces helicus]|eukprot:RKO93065.1 asparaginyl-tRNA synthetase [Blyttiomyces helicus]
MPSAADEAASPNVTIHGWIRTVRVQKHVAFVDISDGSIGVGMQCTMEPAKARSLHTGCSVRLSGTLVSSPGVEQKRELRVSECVVLGTVDPKTYPLHKARVSFDYLRQHPNIRSRSKSFGALWRTRNSATLAIQDFFQSQQFLQIHTPILTSNDCEGAGEAFRVVTNDFLKAMSEPRAPGAPPAPSEFFGHPVYLTVSGQLHAELVASALSRVYTFGPAFRAEPSDSTRHLAEFWMLEAEASFLTSLDDLMSLAEASIRSITDGTAARSADDLAFFAKWVDTTLPSRLDALTAPFARMTYTEAITVLSAADRTWTHPVRWGLPLQTEHERYLAEVHCRGPVFVTDYPTAQKPFYMLASSSSTPDRETVACFDLLVPGVGELVGGSLREHDVHRLETNLRRAGLDPVAYDWYLDLRRFGTVPHGGFGMGFERFLAYITGMANLKDLAVVPRWLGHCRY